MVLQSGEKLARLSVKNKMEEEVPKFVLLQNNSRGVHRKARKHNTRAKTDRDVTLPKNLFQRKVEVRKVAYLSELLSEVVFNGRSFHREFFEKKGIPSELFLFFRFHRNYRKITVPFTLSH